jgi:N-acetylmuramoyl-L-alanine amidase
LASSAQVSPQTSNEDRLFREARSREATLRHEIDAMTPGRPDTALLARARTLVGAYEDIASLFPRSGPIGDDALWLGATLAADSFWEFGEAGDRDLALRMYSTLTTRYPGSPLASQVPGQTQRLLAAPPAPTPPAASVFRAPTPTATATTAPLPGAQPVLLTVIRREVLPDALRVTIELDGEATFHDAQVDGTSRLALDLHNARPAEALRDAAQVFPDGVVRRIRVSGLPGMTARVILDLSGRPAHTTYALYNPYRVVIDFARETLANRQSRPEKPASPEPSASASRNTGGGFSLSRQLGLGVARVVIDPGHGGHDPGALADGLSEADLVLDLALRLERRLARQPGIEVVLTRRTNVFVPLEARTAMANREAADLFLSIHANASEDERLRGVETYFLNFAPTPAAEAVAARENAAASGTMSQLPDIVRAIALNDKIDESRDFASLVQAAMWERLKRANKGVRDLGVKQAPFVVLVGATMPSVLAEVSFVTNPQEAALLRGSVYREQIAEALFNGVVRYQKSLKAAARTVSSR